MHCMHLTLGNCEELGNKTSEGNYFIDYFKGLYRLRHVSVLDFTRLGSIVTAGATKFNSPVDGRFEEDEGRVFRGKIGGLGEQT